MSVDGSSLAHFSDSPSGRQPFPIMGISADLGRSLDLSGFFLNPLGISNINSRLKEPLRSRPDLLRKISFFLSFPEFSWEKKALENLEDREVVCISRRKCSEHGHDLQRSIEIRKIEGKILASLKSHQKSDIQRGSYKQLKKRINLTNGPIAVLKKSHTQLPMKDKIKAFKSPYVRDPEIFLYLNRNEIRQFVEYSPLSSLDRYSSRYLPSELSFFEELSFFDNICSGLQAIHDANFVHCDLKPANIMIFQTNKKKIAKIIDTDDALDLSQPFKKGLIPVGSVLYMSPEHAKQEAISTKADIFSLGKMLYDRFVKNPKNQSPLDIFYDKESISLIYQIASKAFLQEALEASFSNTDSPEHRKALLSHESKHPLYRDKSISQRMLMILVSRAMHSCLEFRPSALELKNMLLLIREVEKRQNYHQSLDEKKEKFLASIP